MSESHTSLPSITDGSGPLGHFAADVFLRPDVGLELHAQVEADGSYRTSVLTIGQCMTRFDIFAERDQMERLHRLIGQHLEQLADFAPRFSAKRVNIPTGWTNTRDFEPGTYWAVIDARGEHPLAYHDDEQAAQERAAHLNADEEASS
jgi:hypothetical protein